MDASSGPRRPGCQPGVDDARRLVRHRPRPVPARARAGVLRPDGRRHLRLPRAAGRPARVPVPRAEPHPVALDARLRSARRHHRRPARPAVRRERGRPDRDAARARVHRRPASDAARGLPRDPARRPDRDRGLQSVFAVRRQALFRARADAAVERQFHRALPAQGLADAARLRRRRRPPRRLRAAVRATKSGCTASASSSRSATAGGRSPAASTSCAQRRKCSACACSRPRGSDASGARRRWRRPARAKA